METIGGLDRLRAEMQALSGDLRGAKLGEFQARVSRIESNLPTLARQAREAAPRNPEAAAGLRAEMLRLAALLETVAAYARARLALEPTAAESYGPSGSPLRNAGGGAGREA